MAHTARNVKDRVVQFPARYKLVPIGGTTDTFDLVAQPGIVSEVGTAINKAYLQPLEDNLADASTQIENVGTKLYPLQREVANLKAVSALKDRVDGASGIFYDLIDEANGGSIAKLDTTKTTSKQALTVGTTVLTDKINAVTGQGFATGQEITIFDDVNLERRLVTRGGSEITTGTATVTTPTTVVSPGYDTSGNGGRKLVMLSNGWLVAGALNGLNMRFYKSTDNGSTWSPLTFITTINSIQGWAFTSFGNKIYATHFTGNSILYCHAIDATTVTNSDQWSVNRTAVDSNQSQGGVCSIIAHTDGTLHAAWESKNSAYPNSFNIRYSKSTDGGATWETPTQLTTSNTTGVDKQKPCITVRSNNNPVILYTFNYPSTSQNNVYSLSYNTSWGSEVAVYVGGAYNQTNLCAAVAPNGRIWAAWAGLDATDSTMANIRVKYSDNGGVTWVNGGVTAEKITAGNTHYQDNPTIGIDKNNKAYIVWQGRTASFPSHYQIRRIIWSGTSWGSITELTSTATAFQNPQTLLDNTLDFSDPLIIYQEAALSVKFRGTWVTQVVTNHLEVQALTKAFKSGAMICRSSVIVDTVNKLLKFGGWDAQAMTTVATNVVASSFNVGNNGGRKLVVLSNGWVVAAIRDTSGSGIMVNFYVDKRNGNGFTLLAKQSIVNASSDWAIVSRGTVVYFLTTNKSAMITQLHKFDATQGVGDFISSLPSYSTSNLETAQTYLGSCSLAIHADGALHAVWDSKNSTYPNSTNIRYSKSTDGGVTWSTADNVSKYNNTGTDNMGYACITLDSSGSPVIVATYTAAGPNHRVHCYRYSSGWLAAVNVVGSTSHLQLTPSLATAPNGRIWCAWIGRDATDTTQFNLRTSYSDNGGATWSSEEKRTTGNTYDQGSPSVSVDKNGNAYLMWYGKSAANPSHYQVRRLVWNGSSWGVIADLTSNTAGDILNVSSVMDNTLDFTDPLTVYQDAQASAVKFRGTWLTGGQIPVLVEDLRYNIEPAAHIKSVVAWVDREADAGLTLTAALSVHGTTENPVAMTKTSATVDSGTTEDQFVGSVATAAAKGTLRVTMTRSSTGVDKGIKQVTGVAGL